mmetsp:Transcript_7278/g.8299  ORF Transcript_7278/g.8299 Transcript_7278/m.8299 type:complete len:269 (+) Transcript_7278:365-1171(+)
MLSQRSDGIPPRLLLSCSSSHVPCPTEVLIKASGLPICLPFPQISHTGLGSSASSSSSSSSPSSSSPSSSSPSSSSSSPPSSPSPSSSSSTSNVGREIENSVGLGVGDPVGPGVGGLVGPGVGFRVGGDVVVPVDECVGIGVGSQSSSSSSLPWHPHSDDILLGKRAHSLDLILPENPSDCNRPHVIDSPSTSTDLSGLVTCMPFPHTEHGELHPHTRLISDGIRSHKMAGILPFSPSSWSFLQVSEGFTKALGFPTCLPFPQILQEL